MSGAQVRTTMARVIAEACSSASPNPGAVWLAPLARRREDQDERCASPADDRPEAEHT